MKYPILSSVLFLLIQQGTPHEAVWPEHPLILPDQKGAVAVDLSNPDVQGSVKHSVRSGTVTMRWNYEVLGLTEGMGGAQGRWKSQQECTLSFTPTEVACLDENIIGVAGVDEDGDTVLQIWTLKSPATPSVAYTPTGDRLVPDLQVEVTRRRVVHRVPSEGQRYIGALFRNWGQPTKPFVYMTDSRELYCLDLESETLTKVASPTDSGVLLQPGLATTRFENIESVVHSDMGSLYWLFPESETGTIVFFVDSDSDGTLDQTSTLPANLWGTTPHADVSLYLRRR